MSEAEEIYFDVIGKPLALPAFIVTWWYCADHYGILLGFGLGWLPAGLVALMVMYLWPIALFVFGMALMTPAKGTFWEIAEKIAIWEIILIAVIAFFGIVSIIYVTGHSIDKKTGWPRVAFIAAFPVAVILFFAGTTMSS